MYKKYIIGLFALCCIGAASAQNATQAKKLFEQGEFEKAKPDFKRLVKQSPGNAGYNYWYGACCYETGEKEEAQPYLEKSAARRYIDAYRYLGKLYNDLYRFDDAVANYEEHLMWLEKKNRPTEMAEAELEQIRRSARMIKGVENVTVIDSFVVNKASFLGAYKISMESGKVYSTPDVAGTVYETEMENKQIYADLSPDSLMQLYTRVRLLDGWSEPEPVESLNDENNVSYPFLMSDGITLYFAKDGESSLGGYDIFVTRYDSEDGSYLRPDNIGMPFNSPANDYLYAVDEFNNIGWFASDRYQPADSVCVYVFIPNESKEVYNYEATDPQLIIDVATLRNIRSTWQDEDKVRQGKQRLAALKYKQEADESKKGDFTFIIDDSATYHTLADFRSEKARKLYLQLTRQQQDLESLKKNLESRRTSYASGNKAKKQSLTPAILELEKRTKQLGEEIAALIKQMRNEEIKLLKR